MHYIKGSEQRRSRFQGFSCDFSFASPEALSRISSSNGSSASFLLLLPPMFLLHLLGPPGSGEGAPRRISLGFLSLSSGSERGTPRRRCSGSHGEETALEGRSPPGKPLSWCFLPGAITHDHFLSKSKPPYIHVKSTLYPGPNHLISRSKPPFIQVQTTLYPGLNHPISR